MPELDLPELDFEPARQELRDQILAPDFAAVRSRVGVIRRRRRSAAFAAALACLAMLGGAVIVGRAAGPAPEVVASPDTLPQGAVWRGGPITVHGLDGPVLDLPGEVRDVQFADPQHGYALAAQCDGGQCDLALAASTDGGRTWRAWAPPVPQVPAGEVPRLVPVDPTGVVLAGPTAWFGRYGQPGWQRIDTADPMTADQVAGGRLGLGPAAPATPGNGCVGRPVLVWRSDGTVARLARQPDLDVCWVSETPAPDGAWWVGGSSGGVPAVAVTRDGGRTWHRTDLAGPAGSWAQVSARGIDVYAVTLTARGGNPYPETLSIQGVYRSTGGGQFSPAGDRIGTLIGDVVPLPDGRLLAAGPNWYLTGGAATELKPAGGSLPWVYRLQATPGGYVALNLFQAGWTAVSQDGENWQKVNVR